MMKQKLVSTVISSLAIALALCTTALAADDFPEVTPEGLHRIHDSKLFLVYAKEGVDLGIYDRVWLVDAAVAFKKNWQRDQNRASLANRVSDKDMERMKSDLAGLFHEVFTEKLKEAGHELVNEAAQDVLIVRPAIVNLDVSAPDTRSASNSYTLVDSAGEMTLYVELYDSVSSDMIAQAYDREADRGHHTMQWQTKADNKRAAKKILNAWADTLVNALDHTQGTATGSGDSE